MMVQKENQKSKRWTPPKNKGKRKVPNEPLSSKPNGRSGPSLNDECFHYKGKGHWSRNCKKYLEDKKKKGSETSTSGMNVIEINIALSSSESWAFNTGSMIHTCKSLQGLSNTRRFAKGELDIRVGNSEKVAVLAVGTYQFSLPSGLVLELNNCYCIPVLSRNIISSSCLDEVDGYKIVIENKRCSIYYNNIFYAQCPLVNGLYVLDLEDKSVYNINAKRL